MQAIHSLLTFCLLLLVGVTQFFVCRALPVAPRALLYSNVNDVGNKTKKTTTTNQQYTKTLATRTMNYSIEALLAAYLFKYGWQLVVKLFCGAWLHSSRRPCALAYHIGSTSQ